MKEEGGTVLLVGKRVVAGLALDRDSSPRDTASSFRRLLSITDSCSCAEGPPSSFSFLPFTIVVVDDRLQSHRLHSHL